MGGDFPFSTLTHLRRPQDPEKRWQTLVDGVKRHQLAAALRLFAEANIEPVLIKGFVSAQFYPSEHSRQFADHDIAVARTDFAEAVKFIARMSSLQINIDLHCELRHLDTLPWAQILERTQLMQVGDLSVRVPCPEDHLRVVAVHWLNDGGQYKERLWDIYYAVANRPAGFDWDKSLLVVSPTRRKWVITTIGLANKYLGLRIDDLPFAKEAKDIPKWITQCVEAEWATDVRLLSLHVVWRNPKQLIQQIRKRLPPNPIQATIECEGEFDDSSRIKYQIRSVFKRLIPSIKRVSGTIINVKNRADG